jgi:hypothetical protein
LIALIINAHPSRRWTAANCAHASTASPRRTLIRKTSLLHKIEPTALRSSSADRSGVSHQISAVRSFLITDHCFPIPDWSSAPA